MKLEMLLDKAGDFTGLIKIKDFTSIQECFEIINNYFGSKGNEFYTYDANGKNYKYIYIDDEGEISFVESLTEFAEGFHTEYDWSVFSSIKMN